MKKISNVKLLSLLLALFCVNFVFANELEVNNETTQTRNLQQEEMQIASAELELLDKAPPLLVAPIVEDAKKSSKQKSQKIDLKAIIFDPDAQFNAQAVEEGREMTKAEEAQYNLHEALHGEVQKLSTKGLLADKLKINVDNEFIDSIQPWIDYNGYFSNVWSGDDYKNTLYGINFADVGIHVNMKDKRYHAKFMISPVKGYTNKTYFQALFADNYITRKIGKNNTVLVGHTWLPIGFEGQESPLVWQYFARSQTSLNYTSARALGTKLSGNYKYANYSVGLYSSGRGFTDWFPGPEGTAWVELKPTANLDEKKYGKLTIGAGLNAGNSSHDYKVATGGVKYEYKRLKAITEFGIADGANGALGCTSNKSKGINGTLAYRLTPKTEISARYDWFDPNTDKANDIRTEYTAGINYFIKDYAARLMLNAVLYSLESGTYGTRLMLGTQIVL